MKQFDLIATTTFGLEAVLGRELTGIGVSEDRKTVNGRIQSRVYNKILENGDSEDRIAYEVSISKITPDADRADVELISEISADKK